MVEPLLRPARETDFPAIRELIHQAGINPTGLDWRRFIVAETPQGQFAGCGQLKPHGDGTVELASLAVIPALRGQGVARRIIERLAADGPRPLYLTCRERLGTFYTRFGFRPIAGDDLPKYFRRISQLAGMIRAMRLIEDKLLVMVLD